MTHKLCDPCETAEYCHMNSHCIFSTNTVKEQDRALRQPALPEGWKQTAYGPAQSLKSLMAEDAARVDMPVVLPELPPACRAYQVDSTMRRMEDDYYTAYHMREYALTALAAKDSEIARILAASRHSADLCTQALADIKAKDAEIAALKADAAKYERLARDFGKTINNHCMAMQSALIDYELTGPAAGMSWIHNTLWGPGLLPDMEEARLLGGAQAWFDAKSKEEEDRLAALAATPPKE